LAGRLGRQTWPADLAGRLGRQTRQADLAGRLGRQIWPADLAGRLGRQTWPADLAGRLGRSDLLKLKMAFQFLPTARSAVGLVITLFTFHSFYRDIWTFDHFNISHMKPNGLAFAYGT
jgi:hypothetical protein